MGASWCPPMSWLCLLLIQRSSLLSLLLVPDLAPDLLVDTCGIYLLRHPTSSQLRIQGQSIVRKLDIVVDILFLGDVDILLARIDIGIEVGVPQQCNQ